MDSVSTGRMVEVTVFWNIINFKVEEAFKLVDVRSREMKNWNFEYAITLLEEDVEAAGY